MRHGNKVKAVVVVADVIVVVDVVGVVDVVVVNVSSNVVVSTDFVTAIVSYVDDTLQSVSGIK